MKLVLSLMVLCAAVMVYGQLLVPVTSAVTIAGAFYTISFERALLGPVSIPAGIRLESVSSQVVCPFPGVPGRIRVSADLFPKAQAKAFIHETVHIAQTCDMRDLPVDEKIAQDVSDLLDSPEGGFILKELK